MVIQESLSIKTPGRALLEITDEVAAVIQRNEIAGGLCHLFLRHTSASLIICENADPTVCSDLEHFMQRLVRDGDPEFRHRSEGPDDMAAHIRSVLTAVSLTVPVTEGRLLLGVWQGIYLWEHRLRPHTRKIVVTVYGD